MLAQLIHNGVLVPEPPAPHGLVVTIRGEPVALSPKQEEMVLAWARKEGTPYVEDRTFAQNFLGDLSRELAIEPALKLDDTDLGPAVRIVRAERQAKARLTPEERKAQAAARKAQREALRAQYGYAQVNGERVELGNYLAEPSGIFMGRGQHPLRGRWKEGARQSDITLNLSPDAPRPPCDWAEIVWQPDSLWVARWPDKLSGKIKYVWLSDTASVKQAREAAKFDKAHVLHAELETVRDQIQLDLLGADGKRRMLPQPAT
jgi:DNA topoisomerase-1